jgi:hypothetical protein
MVLISKDFIFKLCILVLIREDRPLFKASSLAAHIYNFGSERLQT